MIKEKIRELLPELEEVDGKLDAIMMRTWSFAARNKDLEGLASFIENFQNEFYVNHIAVKNPLPDAERCRIFIEALRGLSRD